MAAHPASCAQLRLSQLRASDSSCLLSRSLLQVLNTALVLQAGFGMTDLDPLWHPRPGRSMFDIGRISQLDGETIKDRLATFMGTLLQAAAGVCSYGICKVLLALAVTVLAAGACSAGLLTSCMRCMCTVCSACPALRQCEPVKSTVRLCCDNVCSSCT